MYKINRIKISGFRRLQNIDVQARPFLTLIGANGVGKTSFLDAWALLAASASGDLNAALSRQGGLASLVTRDGRENLSFLVDMEIPGYAPLEYGLALDLRGTGYAISGESLSQEKSGYSQPFLHIDSSDGDIRYYENEAEQHRPYRFRRIF